MVNKSKATQHYLFLKQCVKCFYFINVFSYLVILEFSKCERKGQIESDDKRQVLN